jgi:hypothetical protein
MPLIIRVSGAEEGEEWVCGATAHEFHSERVQVVLQNVFVKEQDPPPPPTHTHNNTCRINYGHILPSGQLESCSLYLPPDATR